MKTYFLADNDFDLKNCVATVGFFDGVHIGHQFLIKELKTIAKTENKKSIVVTFAQHPRKVLHATFQPALLTTLDEKLLHLEQTGIDACVVLDFSIEMAQLTAFDFLKNILQQQLDVSTLLVGHDHRFGHNRADGFDDYKRYGSNIGMEVVQASRFSTDDFNHISSSEIRNAIQNGDVSTASKLLNYNYSFVGSVVDGFKVGRKIGFPTANIKLKELAKIIPNSGVYAVQVVLKGDVFKGMMNIGLRPTLDNGNDISIEVNIFDFDANIYENELEIVFKAKIRNEIKFNSVDELIVQLKNDKLEVLKCFELE